MHNYARLCVLTIIFTTADIKKPKENGIILADVKFFSPDYIVLQSLYLPQININSYEHMNRDTEGSDVKL
jgi:hypothetical protein